MAVLDKFISVMFDQGAGRLVLATGAAVTLDVEGSERPVTRELLTSPKVMALVREIAPDGMKDHLDAESRMAFGYAVDGKRVDVEIIHMGADVQVVISPARARRSSAAMSMPMEAVSAAAAAAAAAVPSPAAVRNTSAIDRSAERSSARNRAIIVS